MTGEPEAKCEPYANGEGWWHVPGCEHVDWGDDLEFIRNVRGVPGGPAGGD